MIAEGSCAEQAPAWWPWTEALRALLEESHELRAAARPELGVIVPDPAAVTDLQWADPATLDLLRFLAHQAQPGALLLVGAYRQLEPRRKDRT